MKSHAETRLLESARSVLAPAQIAGALVGPDGQEIALSDLPARVRVRFRDERSLAALRARDHLALAEAYLAGRI